MSNELQIVVPMGGEGRRFLEAGFKIPKPLIPVHGKPMVVRAVEDLPTAERIVFLVQQSHIREHQADQVLRQYFPKCRIVELDGLTEGQACTVRLAKEELDSNRPVIVAACDNTHLYNPKQLSEQMQSEAACLIWTYRNDPRVLSNPKQYGWVRVQDRHVLEVSCKVPISDQPLADHAISGCFSFRRAGEMIEYIDQMIQQNIRVRNEFYLDTVPNVMIEAGLCVEIFEVEKYIGWGTPEDLARYAAN